MSEQPSWMPETEEIEKAFEAWYALVTESGEDDPQSDGLDPFRALITTAVEKALAEYDFRSSRDFFGWKKQEDSRHEREVIVARIEELNALLETNGDGTYIIAEDDCALLMETVDERAGALRAELAALDREEGS